MSEAGFEVEFIEREERGTRFVVRGLTPAFANGVRRAMLADVPTMAVETVRVIENTSVMFDEMIGLRLGLIPLTTPPGEFEPGDVVTLALDVEGPATAYSGDIESSDGMVVPADEHIPIIELKESQRLAFEAEAVLGRGKSHAKHQGGVAVGYRHLQRVEVDGALDAYEDREPQIVRGVVEIDGDLVPAEAFDNDLTNEFPEQAVTVEDVPGAFVFRVETDGSMAVDDLVAGAIRSLADRADELEAAVQL